MILLYRARLCLVAAVLAATVLVGVELPISELVHQQGELSATARQVAAVESRNTQLRADVSALHEDGAIAAIAHEEYGLVEPGQRSYVILPSRGASRARGALGEPDAIPAGDLVLGPASEPGAGASRAPRPARPSLFARVVDRLEFWRWAL